MLVTRIFLYPIFLCIPVSLLVGMEPNKRQLEEKQHFVQQIGKEQKKEKGMPDFPIYIPRGMRRFSPFFERKIAEISDTLTYVKLSHYGAFNLVTLLLEKLDARYKKVSGFGYEELLKTTLANNNEVHNKEFCWKNIAVLRHELYEHCKKNDCLEKEKKVLLFLQLADVTQKLELCALHYFFSVFIKEFSAEKLREQNNFSTLWNQNIPKDINYYVAQFIISPEQRELLLKNVFTFLEKFKEKVTYADGSYYCVEGKNAFYIYKVSEKATNSIQFPFIAGGYLASVYKRALIFDNAIFGFTFATEDEEMYDEQCICITTINNDNDNDDDIYITARALNEKFELKDSEIIDFSINKNSKELIILVKANDLVIIFSFSLDNKKLSLYQKIKIPATATSFSLSDDGSFFSFNKETADKLLDSIFIVNVKTSKETIIKDKNLEGMHDEYEGCVFFSKDNSKLIVAYFTPEDYKWEKEKIAVFDTCTGKKLYALAYLKDPVASLFVVDNYIVYQVYGTDLSVIIDLSSGIKIASFKHGNDFEFFKCVLAKEIDPIIFSINENMPAVTPLTRSIPFNFKLALDFKEKLENYLSFTSYQTAVIRLVLESKINVLDEGKKEYIQSVIGTSENKNSKEATMINLLIAALGLLKF